MLQSVVSVVHHVQRFHVLGRLERASVMVEPGPGPNRRSPPRSRSVFRHVKKIGIFNSMTIKAQMEVMEKNDMEPKARRSKNPVKRTRVRNSSQHVRPPSEPTCRKGTVEECISCAMIPNRNRAKLVTPRGDDE